jgi:hypothetical protein
MEREGGRGGRDRDISRHGDRNNDRDKEKDRQKERGGGRLCVCMCMTAGLIDMSDSNRDRQTGRY